MTLSSEWKESHLVTIDLPFPMLLAWDTKQSVRKITVNKVAAPYFTKAFNNIWNQARYQIKQQYGFKETAEFYNTKALELLHKLKLDLFGGTFNFRAQRGSSSISMHAYAIAIDVDPAAHGLGNKTATFPAWYVKCWADAGFAWGGNWTTRRDSMHFEITKLP